MGVAISSCYNYTKRHETTRRLRAKIQLLEEEIKEMRRGREQDGQAYEQHVAAFACKEEEWRQQKRKQQEENARLRLRLAEEEEKVKRLEKGAAQGVKEWQEFGAGYVVEQMKIEQARREEAVEKWKQLYLAIKTELDDLIQRTHQTNGERYCWRAEQAVVEELQKELASKEEAMASLSEKMQQVEKEGMRREREIDILRQSLRILSSSKQRERSSRPKKCINSSRGSLRTG